MIDNSDTVFLATLGQRPEAISMALEVLLAQGYTYAEVGLLHTEPNHSGIAEAFEALNAVFQQDYPGIAVRNHELTLADGKPLLDIYDSFSAEAYFRGVVEVLKTYRVDGFRIHLLVSGGRKAMSIYATAAAALVIGERDRVWTSIVSPELMVSGQFHVPPGRREDIQLVHLPVRASRVLPGTLANVSVDDLVNAEHDIRGQFLADLTPRQRELADILKQRPYATYQELADVQGVAPDTIETQLYKIYKKLETYYDIGQQRQRKAALLDVLNDRL